MASLFWRQFRAILWKNWLVQFNNPFLNIVNCFILPVALAGLLSAVPLFLSSDSGDNRGIGSPLAVRSLQEQFGDGSRELIWADGTNGAGSPTAQEIMDRVTSQLSPQQRRGVRRISSPDDIRDECPIELHRSQRCFLAVTFDSVSTEGSSFVNYTIYSQGDWQVDVKNHQTFEEQVVLPVQWALDQAIIQLRTGAAFPAPEAWPYAVEYSTVEIDAETRKESYRLFTISLIIGFLSLAYYAVFSGIAYRLPAALAADRASGLTSHMKAMGLKDSARIIALHLSMSLTYLPAWIVSAVLWHVQIWSRTSVAILILAHVVFGLSLASWSIFVAVPFGKSPGLAAVVTTFAGLAFATIAFAVKDHGTITATVLTIFFPPMFYMYAIRGIGSYELVRLGTNMLKGGGEYPFTLIALVIAAIVNIFLWPCLAVALERWLYDARLPSQGPYWKFWTKPSLTTDIILPDDVAISVRNLGKVYRTSKWPWAKGRVQAIDDLSFDIPKSGIFGLLGSNGAGKSTAMAVMGGLEGPTSGQVVFQGGALRPPRGTISIVPQKNVLFPELSCMQTLQVWQAIKWSPNSDPNEDLEGLLQTCGLGKKINSNAGVMSGGQKRKLQLAIGLLGDSKIVLVDECTSGVDALSRRGLWKALTSFRDKRTIIFTTHFLDEADFLADQIAILASPGKLVASGSPVSLKNSSGEGYSISITLHEGVVSSATPADLHRAVQGVAPAAQVKSTSDTQFVYLLQTKDTGIVRSVLNLLDSGREMYNIASYDILGTTLEDIFLDVMAKNGIPAVVAPEEGDADDTEDHAQEARATADDGEDDAAASFELGHGRPVSPFRQALTIFHKRCLVARRSWLSPLITITVAVAGSCIPLLLIVNYTPSCTRDLQEYETRANPMFVPAILGNFGSPWNSETVPGRTVLHPRGLIDIFGTNATDILTPRNISDTPDAFFEEVKANYTDLYFALSLDEASGQTIFGWTASFGSNWGSASLNLASNALLNREIGGNSSVFIMPHTAQLYGRGGYPIASLPWAAFFGVFMSLFPAFYTLYVARERQSSVQAMQLSNGLSDPLGLWLGHLLFDTISVVVATTIIAAVYAGTASGKFYGLGLLWLVMTLYGITSALLAYCASIWMESPLKAFATVAAYQFVIFLLYLIGNLLAFLLADPSKAVMIITVIHFTIALIAPICSLVRAAFVSSGAFELLCDGTSVGDGIVGPAGMVAISRFGGPILYLVVQMLFLMSLLVWFSGSQMTANLNLLKALFKSRPKPADTQDELVSMEEAEKGEDALKVLGVSKTYDEKVVDDVTVSMAKNTVFALLGPNGAGKTTMLNMIRGDVSPDAGDIIVNGTSVLLHPRAARASLGVCPQFTAIDSQLSVREHLYIYGRLKGVPRAELEDNIQMVLKGTALVEYADRLANKLSGGNKRKLALGIALMGNPSVLLIDEYSTGIDAKMKRDMWRILKKVARGKTIIVTTHSMEEASAVASEVGILAARMLAGGTPDALVSRYGAYEVHFVCRNEEEVTRAKALMSSIPGSKMADDVATRFEVPVDPSGNGFSLGQLFGLLSSQAGSMEYTVQKATLESVFLKVIRDNNAVVDEDTKRDKKNKLFGLF
ncbi:nod factor export ATP-binding protein I [Coprinopsis sp. MPI-PUGE-AT-0042]|nr:nod factor export ATP-binding protein I [Coprinopsis sp. MPI-PUGE-AT-0042]